MQPAGVEKVQRICPECGQSSDVSLSACPDCGRTFFVVTVPPAPLIKPTLAKQAPSTPPEEQIAQLRDRLTVLHANYDRVKAERETSEKHFGWMLVAVIGFALLMYYTSVTERDRKIDALTTVLCAGASERRTEANKVLAYPEPRDFRSAAHSEWMSNQYQFGMQRERAGDELRQFCG